MDWGWNLVSRCLAGSHRWQHLRTLTSSHHGPHKRVLQYWSSLWPQTLLNLGTGMVLGHSSPCSHCSPHPQRMVWGNYRDLEQWQRMVLEKLCPSYSFDSGSTYPVQLGSTFCCWLTQCHLQTAPALGKGQTVHREEGRTWALAVEEQHQDWYSTQERPQCRYGWACQADREGL